MTGIRRVRGNLFVFSSDYYFDLIILFEINPKELTIANHYIETFFP
jgi:hypothetical protein